MQPEVTNIKRFWLPTINDFHLKSLGIPEQAQKTRLNQKWAQEWRYQTKNEPENGGAGPDNCEGPFAPAGRKG